MSLLRLTPLAALAVSGAALGSPFAYVTNIDSSRQEVVTVIDLATDAVETTLYAGGAWANAVAVHPDGTQVYVGTRGGSVLRYTANENMHLALPGIDFTSVPNTLTTPPANGVAVHPDGTTIYATLATTRYLAVIRPDFSGFELVELPYDNPKFVAVAQTGDAIYVVHEAGELSVADLVYDPSDEMFRPDPATIVGRGQVVGAAGGVATLGSWLAVSEPAQERMRLFFLPGSGSQNYAIPDDPTGVVARMENNSARFHVTQENADQVFTVGGFPSVATGSGPRGIAHSPDQNVLVVANYGADTVSILRPTPVVVSDASLHGPDAVAVGPLLPPAAASRRSLPFIYENCNDAITSGLTVTNKGPGFLRPKRARIDGRDRPAYQLVADTCSDRTLAPDATCTLKVKFTPIKDAGAKGSYLGSLRVDTNDPHLQLLEVALTAKPLKLACGK